MMMRLVDNGDVHAGEQNLNSTSFDVGVMEEELGEEMMETNGEREIWQIGIRDEKENLLNVNVVNTSSADHTNSTLYTDHHFSPCISSSSSSTPALTKPPIASSSSASSSAIYFDAHAQQQLDFHTTKTTRHHAPHEEALSSTADGSIVDIGDVDCMHLIDGEDLWDPSSILHTDDDQNTRDNDQYYERDEESGYMLQENSEVVQENHHEKQRAGGLDELGAMFFEWLKTNKHHISAHDLRNIKLKRSTIESASKRLGNTKEGRKQLLKLILQWVEQCQLHKKLSPQQTPAAMSQIPCQYDEPFPNPNPNHLNSIPTDHPNYTCLTPPPPPSNSMPHPATMMAAPPPLFAGYMGGDPRNYYSSGGVSVPSTEFEMLDSVQSWPPSQFALASHYNSLPENGNFAPIMPQPMPQSTAVYSDHQYPYPVFNNGNGIVLVRQDSGASKEARKKRMMAQQRRCLVHHYRHHPPNQNKHHHNDTSEQQNAANNIGGENCTNNIAQASPTGNWVFWPPAATVPAVVMLAQPPTPRQQPEPVDWASMQRQSYQQQAQSEHRQGYKAENNLKLLLQKVLKQSDVGSLGRIVLPKKEAEKHLPELEERDGMPIVMEDIGTSRVWSMRYRFWPNNKSRMYLLENTGEFVRANGLLEGDFIVIYSDIKCGKYLIRGVKVRQQALKAERKKSARRRNLRNSASVAAAGKNGNSSSPSKQTVK